MLRVHGDQQKKSVKKYMLRSPKRKLREITLCDPRNAFPRLAPRASWISVSLGATSKPAPTVPRSVPLPSTLRSDVALIIQGVRRCGKSTLLRQLVDRYSLDISRCLFINFEDPRLAPALDHTTLDLMVDAFESDRGSDCTYLLDEIQWVDGWQRWLRGQLDRPRGRRFVVTGSNAHLLSGELGSSLTGRHITVELFPFDLDEFLVARPGATVEDYLDCGGFPAAATSPDRDMLLRGYFEDIVERDMRERVAARSSLPLRHLVQMLYESAGGEMSVRRVSAALGISADTAGLYVAAAEGAYLAFGCPFFAWSTRKRQARNRKFYPIDTGLRRACVGTSGRDRGKQLECATFLLLRRRYRHVSYWRGRREVDFVVMAAAGLIPVQVSWDETTERARQAVDEFQAAHHNAAEAVFVTRESYAAGVPELAGDLPT
jgi:predicted AAA+ superfamily ATPase